MLHQQILRINPTKFLTKIQSIILKKIELPKISQKFFSLNNINNKKKKIRTNTKKIGFEEKYVRNLRLFSFSKKQKKGNFELDGSSLSPEKLMQLSTGEFRISLSKESIRKIKESRSCIDSLANSGEVVYGINTGFGNFANVLISNENLIDLQQNLIRSHAAGVGDPLSPTRTRMLLALRINVLAKGYSGISLETLNKLIDAFNHDCLPKIPEKGSVGASGDLAPLAHLALGLMGEGEMWDFENQKYEPSEQVLKKNQLTAISPKAKEGLAMINGTQFITSLTTEALIRSENVARQSCIVAAMTVEALRGVPRAYDADLHALRPHKGQIKVAERMRKLLHREDNQSEIFLKSKHAVQDAYTLRCIPQIHGIVDDMLMFARSILSTELNSATDNPIVVPHRKAGDYFISGGNFHGEYPAKAADLISMAVAELANISERRIERLVNSNLSGPNVIDDSGHESNRLPPFLIPKDQGLNSGFMIAHCTAAALTSENKVLVHPSSNDTISTSAAQEDHVSMGAFAARKALMIVENVEKVLSIELLAACQGIDLLRPLKTTEPLERVHALVRKYAKKWERDRFMSPDIESIWKLFKEGKFEEVISDIHLK
ncbi:histidine ammonia-lyase [Anaeramoeba ignava]|uniref:Histidine ammonia-lyase n=1 Tax=Anaeramoeba ignava TaxID=1746090 RepID=A0A9Q0LT76_ANAIG|nr:histidine ammonia-lyase [Anaeramoeba ignava]